MKKVGILVGREKTFPDALIKNINERSKGSVVAEYIKLGGVRFDAPLQYDLAIDRQIVLQRRIEANAPQLDVFGHDRALAAFINVFDQSVRKSFFPTYQNPNFLHLVTFLSYRYRSFR